MRRLPVLISALVLAQAAGAASVQAAQANQPVPAAPSPAGPVQTRAVSPLIGAATRPLAQRPGTPLQNDYLLGFENFHRARLLPVYDDGGYEQTWAADGRRAVELAAAAAGGNISAGQLDEWIALCSRLAQARCEEPAVLWSIGTCAAMTGRGHDPAPVLQNAFERLSAGPYPRLYASLAALRLADVLRSTDRAAADTAYLDAVGLLNAGINGGEFGAGDERYLFALIEEPLCRETYPITGQRTLLNALADSGKLDPWTAAAAEGAFELREAWAARSGKRIGQLTQGQIQGWQEHLAKARPALADAYRLDPSRPEPAALMIRVVMAESDRHGETMRLWFDRATEAQFDWPAAYRCFMRGLQPQWHGGASALPEFARECENTGRFDTDVPYFAVEAWIWLGGGLEESSRTALWSRLSNDAHTASILDRLASDPANAPRAGKYDTLRACLAWWRGDRAEAARLTQANNRHDDTVAGYLNLNRRTLLSPTVAAADAAPMLKPGASSPFDIRRTVPTPPIQLKSAKTGSAKSGPAKASRVSKAARSEKSGKPAKAAKSKPKTNKPR